MFKRNLLVVFVVIISLLSVGMLVFAAEVDQEHIDLLLKTGDRNVVNAYRAQHQLSTVAPHLLELNEDVIALITPSLVDPTKAELAANVLLRAPQVSSQYLVKVAKNPMELLRLREGALQVLSQLKQADDFVTSSLYELLSDQTTPYLIRISALDSLKILDNENQYNLEPYAHLLDYVTDGRIAFRIDNNSAQSVEDGLVIGIIPIPRNSKPGAHLSIVDDLGNPIAARIQVLSTWPEGYPRIVEVALPITIDAYNTLTGHLVLDASSSSSIEIGQTKSTNLSLSFRGDGLLSLSEIVSHKQEGWVNLMIVAADGSGQFTKVQDAIDAVPASNKERVQIFIRNGVYKEKITVPSNKPFISLIGESSEGTILTYDDSSSTIGPNGSALGTTGSTSFAAKANDFTAENLTFQNTAGMNAGQAVAIRTTGDRMIFSNVRFLGHQDTLYVTEGRQYFVNCYIYGDVDFIFGNATAVFENCDIVASPRGGYVTAASNDQNAEFGYLFLNSRFTSEAASGTYYLGRPWRPYAHVAIINCWLDDHIRPVGWHNWNNPDNEKTARYYEYNNSGPGADTSARVSWSRVLTAEEAARYTVENVLRGSDGWNPKAAR